VQVHCSTLFSSIIRYSRSTANHLEIERFLIWLTPGISDHHRTACESETLSLQLCRCLCRVSNADRFPLVDATDKFVSRRKVAQKRANVLYTDGGPHHTSQERPY